jgi:hypothetical protein
MKKRPFLYLGHTILSTQAAVNSVTRPTDRKGEETCGGFWQYEVFAIEKLGHDNVQRRNLTLLDVLNVRIRCRGSVHVQRAVHCKPMWSGLMSFTQDQQYVSYSNQYLTANFCLKLIVATVMPNYWVSFDTNILHIKTK